MSHPNGWCQNPAHGGFDHMRTEKCVNHVPEAEVLAQIETEAAKQPPAYDVAAAYVAQHRPY